VANSAGRLRLPILGGLVASALVGGASCSSSHLVSSAVISHYQGLPPGVAAPTDTSVAAVRWAGSGQLYVITWGSDCGATPLPTHVTPGGAHRLYLVIGSIKKAQGQVCADKLEAFTSVVEEPVATDDTQSVSVYIDGPEATKTTLPPRT
jgi:hypothetical protein